MNLADSREDSLDGWSARRRDATYTEQQKRRINADTSVHWVGSKCRIAIFEREKPFRALDLEAISIINIYLFSINLRQETMSSIILTKYINHCHSSLQIIS
jgi:hypothetical protein